MGGILPSIKKIVLSLAFCNKLRACSLSVEKFLPKILENTTFDQGSEPFQSFSKLIKYRNELVHYKGRKESWESFEQGMPEFLDKLGLSLRKARKSIQTVREMILEISRMINQGPPYWLREGYHDLPQNIVTNFFEIDIEK